MADHDVKIAITTTADTSGAKAAAASVGSLTTSTHTSGAGMQKFSMLANQASYQIGDFTSQVSMGTSAVRAFGMQAPQMIGALQMAGVVTGGAAMAMGGLAVVLPLVTMAFEKFSSVTDTLKPKMDALNAAVDKNAKLITAAHEAHLKDQAAAEEAIQKWDELEKAKNSAATAGLSSAAKELDAYEALNEALGIQLDMLGTKADLERAAREEAARQALQGQANRAGAATGAIAQTAGQLNDLNAHIAFLQAKSAESDRKVESLRQSMRDPELASGVLDAIQTQFVSALAQKQAIDSSISSFADQAKGLQNKIEAQTAKANDQIAAAEVAIQEIGDTLAADNAVGTAKEVRDRAKQQAADLKSVLAEVTPLNESQRAAVTELQRIAADGKVTADETAAMGAGLSELLGGVRAGITQYNGTVENLITLVQQLTRNQADYQAKVKDLSNQIKQLPRN